MTRIEHLTRRTVGEAPPPCRTCMWWQTPGAERGDHERWTREMEDEVGPWGKLYLDGDRVIGLIQYGPADRFPRARRQPAGPPGDGAALVTCAYLTDLQTPWVLQSLFLAAIGECKDRGFPVLEAFAYRYDADESFPARFHGHRTIFPADFLRDFGFQTARTAGRVELARLDLRGIEAVPDSTLTGRLRARLAPLFPAPAGAG
jgi:hypothetical protein